VFRGKNGCRLLHGVLAGGRIDSQAIVLAIFDRILDSAASPFPLPSA
jgi:hypothetical protein